jgi:hypothetical protein
MIFRKIRQINEERIVYRLPRPQRDGRTALSLTPLELIDHLAAPVPKPRVNRTRYHGVFAPNGRDRAAVTPAKRGKGAKPAGLEEEQEKTPAQRQAAMTPDQVMGRLWSQRFRREPNRFRSTGRISDSTVGHDGERRIIQEWRKMDVRSLSFPSGVAKAIHLSGKAVMSAMGVRRAKAASFLWVKVPPGNFRSSRKQSEQSWR